MWLGASRLSGVVVVAASDLGELKFVGSRVRR